ncbi:indolepyruvate oxidoreductase subunit beta [Natranaerofaba carboxydovora]|uniref:indolepyruvate oxidoreductase subunit beta n=1 Tax=Natranaerofaba carboxydovora TaxID=2742683 RepID=UPI001F145972|nr:indolepyruvate oxidoreductase subunit beta [Natranaerofaba carboxydovora]UMZ73805.1 Pyruvate ferredoxin/flavodoxin oxidoreductase [Natranaerofaba carboxydovora]
MNKGSDILLVGVGGQGTILASRILAHVAQDNNLEVKISEVHGMAQRGGSVVTHLRMGDKVYSPLIQKGQADVILAFEQLEAWRWLGYLREGGMAVVNTQVISPVPVISGYQEYPDNIINRLKKNVDKTLEVDALKLAEQAGNEKTVNVVLLGVLARQLEFEKNYWVRALESIIPEKIIEPNKEAFMLGYNHT